MINEFWVKNKINYRDRLSERIGMTEIHKICREVEDDNEGIQELYNLIYDKDDTIAYQAIWTLGHISSERNKWLYDKQNKLIDKVMACQHSGKRRLLLNLIFRQPLSNPPRVDFLDFCMERMLSKQELPGVQMFCMKLAYEMCRPIPELLQELRTLLDIMEPALLPPSMQAVRKNVLKAMQKEKACRRGDDY